MKNPKILPFGDWFKVYEKAGNNFNKTQRLLESQIFEGKKDKMVAAAKLQAGNPIPDYMTSYFGDDYSELLKAANAEVGGNDPKVRAAVDNAERLFALDPELMGKLSGYSDITDGASLMAVLYAIDYYRKGCATHSDRAVAKKYKDLESTTAAMITAMRRGNFKFNENLRESIQLIPHPSEAYNSDVVTIGKVNDAATDTSDKGVQKGTRYRILQAYINGYNLTQRATGGKQYNWKQAGNHVDTNQPWDRGFNLHYNGQAIDVNVLYLASAETLGKFSKKIDTNTKETAAAEADTSKIAVPFKKATLAQGGADVPATYLSEIQALAKEINEKFDGKAIELFKLVSSASPDYGKIPKTEGWEKYYTSTSGTTDPGNGTDDATANQKLAYQRGVNFMEALNTALISIGHPGFSNYEINWQISNEGGPGIPGIFVDLDIAGQKGKPKVETTTKTTGEQTEAGTKISGTDTFVLIKYTYSL